MFRDRESYERGVNLYVPAMQYSNAVNSVRPQTFSLGSPAVASATAYASSVAANATVGTETAIGITTDGTYGRNVRLAVSGDPGAAGGVATVRGWDYLGQPMLETFSGANGATAILYGKKAFKIIKSITVDTATTNAVTYNLGSGNRLGLPYKGDVVWAKENSILMPVYNRDQIFTIHRDAAQAIAGGSVWVRSPFPGFVASLFGTPDGGGSTNDPVITVEIGGTAVTGLTVTIDTSNAAGLTVTDVPTTPGYSANNRLVPGDLVEIIGAAAASAGADSVGVVLTPTQFVHPVLTDPATATTGDPRGTYESITTLAGFEIFVGMIGDNAVNASDNGGLHGIRHYYA